MQSDADFLGLSAGDEPGQYRFTVAKHLARLDGRLYGGTAIAVSIATAELLSGCPALWMTTQFVATAQHRSEVTVLAELLAEGNRTNQLRVTATADDGKVVFASLGATGRYREGGLTDVFETPPNVTGPQDAEPWDSVFTGLAKFAPPGFELPFPVKAGGAGSVVEMRQPEVLEHPDPGPGRICLWLRRVDGEPITPAVAAYMADMVPLSVAFAFEVMAGGTSLDNTMRIGSFVETEWVLLDLRPHLAVGDYCHGVVHIWSQDGRLMATASQTASMLHFRTEPPSPAN